MSKKRQKIFESIMAAIPKEGWTEEAIVYGLKKAGVSAAEGHKLFPHGIEDVVESFHQWIDEAMETRIAAKRNFKALRVHEKVTFAVRARLEAIASHREAMQRLLTWSLMPRHIKNSTRSLWQAADAVWRAAGDRSTDYNYYTKRILLIAVMKSTLSFWLNDKSSDFSDTWAFLDRRIADVLVVGKGLGVLKSVGLSDVLSFVRSRLAA